MKKKTLSVAAVALAAVMLATGCGQTASSVASSVAASSEAASSVAESTISAEETSYPLTLQIYDADIFADKGTTLAVPLSLMLTWRGIRKTTTPPTGS